MKKSYATVTLNGFEWVFKLMNLNFLMLASSLLGLVVFSLFPSVSATFFVVKEWLTGNKDVPIFKLFFQNFKKNYWRSQIIGWAWTAALIILVVDLYAFLTMEALPFRLAFLSVTLLIGFVFLIGTLHLFPINNIVQLPLKELIKRSFSMGFASLPWTILSFVGVVAILSISFRFPTILFTLAGSSTAFWLTFMTEVTQLKLKEKLETMI